jgi:hypothetical protein
MANFINKLTGKIFKDKFRPRLYRPLPDAYYDIFRQFGEGLYYVTIKSSNNNIVSKAISYVTILFTKKEDLKLAISHCVTVLYSEHLENWFSEEDWKIVKSCWNNYYGNSKQLDSSIKTLVLSSADDNGMNYFDFSQYCLRNFCLRKPSIGEVRQFKVIQFLVSLSPKLYDYTGLVFWWLYKFCSFFNFLQDKESYTCSETIYNAFMSIDFKTAKKENPSPLDLENYNQQYRIYNTPGFFNE